MMGGAGPAPVTHSSQVNLSGYRPITTRRIGQAPPSTVLPVNLLNAQDDANADDVAEEPPEHGWSAHDHYPPSEVLLENMSCAHDAW